MPLVARPLGLAFGLVLGLALNARGSGPADGLFRLVPPDVAAVLAVEDLRGRAREFLESPVAQGFERLPAFQAWIASGRFAQLGEALRKVEHALGEKVETIRDELLGDAVVLALRVPPNGRPEDASGLLLVRGPEPSVARSPDPRHQRRPAPLRRADPTGRVDPVRGVVLVARVPPRKPEADRLFHRPERQYLRVVERRGPDPGRDRPAGRARRGRSPTFRSSSRSAAGCPSTRSRACSLRPASSPGSWRLWRGRRNRPTIARRHSSVAIWGPWSVSARPCNGATESSWTPRRSLIPRSSTPGSGTGRPGAERSAPALRRAPPNALAMASVHVDCERGLRRPPGAAPERQQPRLENLIVALDGILLGRDLQAEILPQLGPGMLAYLEASDGEGEGDANPRGAEPAPAKVIAVGLGNAGGVAAAVENALRTYLAFYALDPQHNRGQLQLETRETGSRKVTTLRPTTPFAFAIDGDRLVLGSSAAAVGRAITFAANPDRGRARPSSRGPFSAGGVFRLRRSRPASGIRPQPPRSSGGAAGVRTRAESRGRRARPRRGHRLDLPVPPGLPHQRHRGRRVGRSSFLGVDPAQAEAAP